jgi:hypothetical protein
VAIADALCVHDELDGEQIGRLVTAALAND